LGVNFLTINAFQDNNFLKFLVIFDQPTIMMMDKETVGWHQILIKIKKMHHNYLLELNFVRQPALPVKS